MSMDPFDIVVSHSTHPSPAVPPAAALQELPELPLPAGAANSPNSLPPTNHFEPTPPRKKARLK